MCLTTIKEKNEPDTVVRQVWKIFKVYSNSDVYYFPFAAITNSDNICRRGEWIRAVETLIDTGNIMDGYGYYTSGFHSFLDKKPAEKYCFICTIPVPCFVYGTHTKGTQLIDGTCLYECWVSRWLYVPTEEQIAAGFIPESPIDANDQK